MTALHFPAHKIGCINTNGKSIVLAAIGPCIQSLSLEKGNVLSLWPRDENDDSTDDEQSGEEERPMKRLKLDNTGPASLGREGSEVSEASIEIIAEGKQRQKGERRRPKIAETTLPNVSHLVVTSNGDKAITVTAEDKAVRVFSVSRSGRLRQLSSRSMPKKCCAITLTRDEQTILTADKFGDVYALPLIPTAGFRHKAQSPQPEHSFKPSASSLTVHTKGNLDALRQQQKQKKVQPKKEGPQFEHVLLLGHVSLLTDLTIAEDLVNGKARPFILTADRDEHIRVSRGIPQTHIINNFCLGHTEFISKLCIIPWAQHLLLAGNGEPSLRLYSWRDGVQRSRFDIIQNLRGDLERSLSFERAMNKIAISGIWPVRKEQIILVALEALPLIFSFEVNNLELNHLQTFKFNGNVLDVADVGDSSEILVSTDTVHKSGSCRHYRDEPAPVSNGIQRIFAKHLTSQSDSKTTTSKMLEHSDSKVKLELEPMSSETIFAKGSLPDNDPEGKPPEKHYSSLGEFIYGLENLRKRGKVEDQDAEETQADEGELVDAPDME